jgi:CubicO group peptidase (beta-lactamase class C family)
MARVLVIVAATLVAIAAWGGLVLSGMLFGWGRPTIAPRGDVAGFFAAARDDINQNANGNAAFVLIENGAVAGQHFHARNRPVDGDTLFQVASLSKWATAWGVMKLAEQGRIDLDAPVARYLTRWRLPEAAFDNDGVTVRRLLSHTAGLGDGLGYGGFAPGDEIQTLEQSLTQASDASPGANGATRVTAAPGSAWKYSGGGYTLLQLLVEEVSGEPFNTYMRREIFEPLGMTRSTFELPAGWESLGPQANVAEVFDEDGSEAIHYRFTATAAASLYTSAADMTRFLQAHLPGPNGEPIGRGVLSPESLDLMRQPEARQFGVEVWGLGVILYAPNNAGDFIIGHDGSNAPAINTTARLDPATGDGIVVLETGNRRLATEIGGDWVFWKTGNVDLFDFMIAMRSGLIVLVLGCVAILLVAGFLLWRRRKA